MKIRWLFGEAHYLDGTVKRYNWAVDSTALPPAVTGEHVHVEAQDAATPGRAASDEVAGSGE